MASAGALAHVARQALPRLVYGNDAGFAENRSGRTALRQARRGAAPPAVGAEAVARAAALQRHGWVALPRFPSQAMDAIGAGYERLIEEPDATQDMGGQLPQCVRYLIDPVARIPALTALLDARVMETLQAYYRSWFEVQHVRMWRIASLPDAEHGRDHYGNVWHTDHHPVSMIKMFVQVSPDVAATGSALRLHDAPRTARIVRSGYLTPKRSVGPARRMIEDERAQVVFDGPPGSALLFAPCRCLHRAGIPAPGRTRGMVQFTFDVSPTPPPPQGHLAAMAPDLNVVTGRPVT